MHQSKPFGSQMPQELLQQILGEFYHHRNFLKSCSLVNSVWLRPDWLSIFVNMPFDIGLYARQITVKEARWIAEASPTRALLLSHFATSVTTLSLSNLAISNFADFTHVVSTLKGLAMLSLDHVQFETNALDLTELMPPNRLSPRHLVTLSVYHCDLGSVFSWLLAYPVVPKVSKLYCGPCETHWKKSLIHYCNYAMANVSGIGLRFPDTTAPPYSMYYYVTGTVGYPDLPLPPARDSPGDIFARFEARYGFDPRANGVVPYAATIRTIRLHAFFGGKGQGSVIRTMGTPRVLTNVSEGFQGRVVFDVVTTSVKDIVEGEMDWQFLEDILETDIFSEMGAVVFLVLSNISMKGLENFVSFQMPRTQARGILRFERANETTIRPIDTL